MTSEVPVLQATFHSASVFKSMVTCIKELVEEGNFTFAPDTGLVFESLDSSSACLIALAIRPKAFADYKCSKSVTFGINIKKSLHKVMSAAPAEDRMQLVCTDNADQLLMCSENKQHSEILRYQVNLMEIDTDQMKIPELDTKCEIKMSASEFQKKVAQLVGFGDTCKITCTSGAITFHTDGDMGKLDIVIKNEDGHGVSIKSTEDVSQTFALRYLTFFAKGASVSDYVIIKMTPEMPLLLEYYLDDGDRALGHLKFFLAPKQEISD
jgi:proliferating cell nuclear antigen (pcna)